MKEFTVTGKCIPRKHYMADTSGKITEVMALVEGGKYFCINRARQYGKTTTLSLLRKRLMVSGEYTPISISFEGASDKMFEKESEFCQKFLARCARYFKRSKLPGEDDWKDESVKDFDDLDEFLTDICSDKKYVLIIDEVDKSSDSTIFLKFLGLLRNKFLLRDDEGDYTFHSVILAGVTDIKNLKVKIKQTGKEQVEDAEKRVNSPWNIAVDFDVDMSLSIPEISSMLADYENDKHTGMDIEAVAQEIRTYTNGYPYLVSRICQKIDGAEKKDWTANGVKEAIMVMMLEESTLVDDIGKNLNNNKNLDDMMFNIIARGEKYEYDPTDKTMNHGLTFGFLIRQNTHVTVGNQFFEMLLYRRYTQRLQIERQIQAKTTPSEVISDGRINMPLLIEKFARHYYESYNNSRKKFSEDECRILFLTYLRPLINGAGFYHVESETRDEQRMDVIVDYGPEQFIIELKLWRGDTKHEDALDQLVGYLDRKNKDVGYLLTFDFRERDNVGAPKMEWVEHGGKKIFDIIVGVAPPKKSKKA